MAAHDAGGHRDAPPRYEWRQIERPKKATHQSTLWGSFVKRPTKDAAHKTKQVNDPWNAFQCWWFRENKDRFPVVDKKVHAPP